MFLLTSVVGVFIICSPGFYPFHLNAQVGLGDDAAEATQKELYGRSHNRSWAFNESNDVSMMNNDITYVFWVYGWNNTGIFLSIEDLIRCDVTREGIHIESQPLKDIPIRQIQKCDVYSIGGRGAWRSMIKLKVDDQMNPKDIFIFPANPSKLANELWNGDEVNAFSELINGILSNTEVTINPNPYYRNKTPKEWMVEKLDAYTSPWVYYHRYRKRLSPIKVIAQIIATVIVLTVLVILMAFFAEYLTH